jgi:hypothetical protein
MARRLQQLGAGRVLASEPTRDSAAKLRAAVAATGLVTVVDNFSPPPEHRRRSSVGDWAAAINVELAYTDRRLMAEPD